MMVEMVVVVCVDGEAGNGCRYAVVSDMNNMMIVVMVVVETEAVVVTWGC